jgi:AcrR family transcriptional regulator
MAKRDTLNRLKRRERKIRENLIIDAARRVFGTKTYDQVSMSEIAKAAGIAKSSIYTYFKSQEELHARIAYSDVRTFIVDLEKRIGQSGGEDLETVISFFLEYYFANQAQWKMVTHYALHGNKKNNAMEQFNDASRQVIDLFEKTLREMGVKEDSRLLAHTLFSSLSGILISFRNYPGRTEEERIRHMKKIGNRVGSMISAFIEKHTSQIHR